MTDRDESPPAPLVTLHDTRVPEESRPQHTPTCVVHTPAVDSGKEIRLRQLEQRYAERGRHELTIFDPGERENYRLADLCGDDRRAEA